MRARLNITRQAGSRLASTSTTETPVVVHATPSRLRSALTTSAFIIGTGVFVVYYYDSRSAIHQWVIPPLMRATLDPEVSHRLALRVLGTPFAPVDRGVDDDIWDFEMTSPVGLAAGFDKDGEAIDGLFGLGFNWVEIGSVTPKAQSGNPKPRVFILPKDDAMINRYGFPSRGHDLMLARLRSRSSYSSTPSPYSSSSPTSGRVLAVNLGKLKSAPPDSIADYLAGVRRFGQEPDVGVLVINVSSPNTPGLRGLQNRGMIEELLDGVCKERDALPIREGRTTRPKIVLKIAPDLDEQALQDVAEAVRESGVDGVIVSNTTIQRPNLQSASANETGGLSGTPLFPLSLKAVKILRSQLPASIPIIGCGGISSGADALEFARAGASTIQLYTAFGYSGAGTARRVKDELTDELHRQGTTWQKVVSEGTAKAWVKPEGQKALDEGERELRGMLDGLGKQLAVGPNLALLENGGEDASKSNPQSHLQLDSGTQKLAELAEAAIASEPHGGPQAGSLPHAQHESRGALSGDDAHGAHGSGPVHVGKEVIEKRSTSA
ncbi:hypothetical protein BDV93DRAFT_452482 [Ceratobasidium sp. AG-I]|nr:hypothetical protein BDV93DRAFT_452482 [Ceratobasidium sp. AG-I]